MIFNCSPALPWVLPVEINQLAINFMSATSDGFLRLSDMEVASHD